MPVKKEVQEVLNGFEKRMKFINIVRMITEYKYPATIRAMFGLDTDKDKLTNIVLAVMVYIKERTLGEDLDCTIADIQHFLDDSAGVFQEVSYDSAILAKYILIDVLQHGGEIASFQTFNSHTDSFEMIPLRLINEEQGKYTLTDDAFDFLFRIKDIDATLDYSVTRFKMQEYMKRDNYSEALEQSRELVSRIRNIKTGMNSFLLLCRENISKVSVDEYESLVGKIRSLLEDEYQELIEIQKSAEKRAEKLSDATTAGIVIENAKKHRQALNEIIRNIETTIDEQRSLINKKSVLARQYEEIIRDSYRVVSYERLNFQEDIMVKLRRLSDFGGVAEFLLFPLCVPELPNHFSVENFYASQKSYDDTEEKDNFDLTNTEENREEEILKERNERYRKMTQDFFSFMQDKSTFSTGDFVDSLQVSVLREYGKEKALPQMLLALFEIGVIDIEDWKQSTEIELKPMGEFELAWCLRQLPEELLTMKQVHFYKGEGNLSFTIESEESRQGFEMSLLNVEVIR